MATPAQIAANRRNAKRSTGPITPEGKAICSQNALKHGLSAKNFRFEDLVKERLVEIQFKALKEDHPPHSLEEEAILRELAFKCCLQRELDRLDLLVFQVVRSGRRMVRKGINLYALNKIANASQKNSAEICDLITRHRNLIAQRSKPKKWTQNQP